MGLNQRKGKKESMDVQELREVPAMLERLDFDDAVGIYASGKVFEAAYERLGLEVPLWVTENLAMLQKYIVAKRKDNFARELKHRDMLAEQFKTREEKRAENEAKRAELRKRLEE
jgi:hypothetical protein